MSLCFKVSTCRALDYRSVPRLRSSSAQCRAVPARDRKITSSRRQLLASVSVGLSLLTQRSLAAEEGIVTYVDISSNPDLTNRETKAVLNNLKIQQQNQVPSGFPTFVREGFDVKIIGEGYTIDENGLIYQDVIEGEGNFPEDDEEVVFDYTGYNENGARIDSSYRKNEPAVVQLGRGTLIPGFELALKGMKVGGKRRVVIPPELGPPVGPSTFFSAKQCEVSIASEKGSILMNRVKVFDVELRGIKSCRQQQFAMFSRTVCE